MDELPSYQEVYPKVRENFPLAASLLEPKRFALEGASSLHYFPPSVAFIADVMSIKIIDKYLNGPPEKRTRELDKIYTETLITQNMRIGCGSPTYFMAPDIANALMDTDPPGDVAMPDIRWPFPAIRVFLPKNLIQSETFDVGWIDIALIASNSCQCHEELYQEVAGRLPPPIGYGGSGASILTVTLLQLNKANPLHFDLNGIAIPVRPKSIEENLADFQSPAADVGPLHGFNHLLPRLALNIVMLMSWAPDEIGTETLLRKEKVTPRGEVVRSALWSPRFIGRPVFGKPKPPGEGASNGRQFFDQVRRGHWKRQPYGPGRSERRLTWVSLYRTRSRAERGLAED